MSWQCVSYAWEEGMAEGWQLYILHNMYENVGIISRPYICVAQAAVKRHPLPGGINGLCINAMYFSGFQRGNAQRG